MAVETMLHRVMRAMEPTYDRLSRNDRRNVEITARAAIGALREPTEGMFEAAWDRMESQSEAFWRAMIDAVLEGR